MFNFLKKDLIIVRIHLIIILLITLITIFGFSYFSTSDIEISLLLFYIPWLVGSILIIRNLQAEYKTNSLQFLMTIPTESWKIVASKYLLVLFALISAYSMIFISIPILSSFYGLKFQTFSLDNLILSISVMFFYFSILIFLYFKYGYSFIQYSMVIALFAIFGFYKIINAIELHISLNIILPIVLILSIPIFYYLSLKSLKVPS